MGVRESIIGYKIFTDGGAKGNPGPAAIGVVIIDSQSEKIIKSFGKKIGVTTNNVAEYRAIIEALKWFRANIKREGWEEKGKLTFFLDSKLVVNQLNGYYRIKNFKLRNLIIKVKQLEKKLGGSISYQLIPRGKNKEADRLVKHLLS